MLIAGFQLVVLLLLHTVAFGLCAWALIDGARRPPTAFTNAGKRTKGFWLTLLGIATAVAFVAIPYPVGIGGLGFFAAAIAAGVAGIYLADVRPAVGPYSGGRGGRRGPGGRSGGW